MTYRDFLYWLQGFMELSTIEALSDKQAGMIISHYNLAGTTIEMNKQPGEWVDNKVASGFIYGLLVMYTGYSDEVKRKCTRLINERLAQHFTKVTGGGGFGGRNAYYPEDVKPTFPAETHFPRLC